MLGFFMSKTKLEVNFHYGQQNFNSIIEKIVINKLKMYDKKEMINYNKNTEGTTIHQKESKR